ncbi:HD domain-containing phosphohydrolase [Magnetospirillum sp. UT-4]|uniref:HD domain-containing phosphohydrolase n=1 Tax=Magnetospirillum sp. UT-4 TaxID=2681467 RepID=UPI00137DB251|nr:HD domain-containing phosphohydrolase [Magnetospirillum sp. UT-4]CAA7616017.1 HD-GYP domain [Magnetospirillum sp. UT-4]
MTIYRPVHQSLAERVMCLHDEIKRDLPGVNRVAIAIYDPRTDIVKSFLHSSEGDSPFEHTVARLADLKPLAELARTGARRVIHDLEIHPTTTPAHNRRLVKAGYRSSYTVPMFNKGTFHGFLFFNSFEPGYFSQPVVHRLRPLAEVVALTAVMELDAVRMIQAAVKTVRQISHVRDEETGSHLERMARYARLIALRLAPRQGLTDEWVELLFQFAPLHDVGKIAVPDHILFKPGRLSPEEFAVMRNHVARGVEIVDVMASTFRIADAGYVRILRNVVAHHHECIDGTGYPNGLAGNGISLEGRIAAVADVFDALTSNRPYKNAWSNQDALDYLAAEAGRKFDADAVEILRSSGAAIHDIQSQFAECDFD